MWGKTVAGLLDGRKYESGETIALAISIFIYFRNYSQKER